MNVGIIGAGLIGKTLAKKFSAAGHHVTLADARGVAAIQDVAQQAGAHAVELAAVGQDVQVLLVSIPFGAIPDLGSADNHRSQSKAAATCQKARKETFVFS